MLGSPFNNLGDIRIRRISSKLETTSFGISDVCEMEGGKTIPSVVKRVTIIME